MLGWKQSVSEFFMGNHAGLYNNEFISFTQVTPSKMIAFALLQLLETVRRKSMKSR